MKEHTINQYKYALVVYYAEETRVYYYRGPFQARRHLQEVLAKEIECEMLELSGAIGYVVD